MAHFRAIIQGQRGEASRLGSKKSGLTGEVAGWTAGVRLSAHAGEEGDTIQVIADAGNGSTYRREYLGDVKAGGVFVPSQALKDRIIQEHIDSLLIPGRA